ncbi:MAG: CobW family GTP-binding protein [Thiohalocapsa sp.]
MGQAAFGDQLPVTLLTGFLGSGKTTLLRRALADRAFTDTAVVINEVGEIAIDHYLVDLVEGDVLELPGGCLCCAMREDLAQTLRGLIERRDAGAIRGFRRLVVETSGLADPGPILFTFGADGMLDQRLRLARVVTLVDAVAGAATLDRFAEAARQAAVADALVISKTDLALFDDALAVRLAALNPGAERIVGAEAQDPAAVLFGHEQDWKRHPRIMPGLDPGIHEPPTGAVRRHVDAHGSSPWAEGPRVKPGHDEDVHAAHTHGIATFTIVLQEPATALQFAMALGGLAQARGYDLLRVKGIVAFADGPSRPAIVQAAQHTMFSPEWLDDWPDADRRSRLVFIVHDIAPDEILAHFTFASPRLLHDEGPPPGGKPSLQQQAR